jgi:hypothetical protein
MPSTRGKPGEARSGRKMKKNIAFILSGLPAAPIRFRLTGSGGSDIHSVRLAQRCLQGLSSAVFIIFFTVYILLTIKEACYEAKQAC